MVSGSPFSAFDLMSIRPNNTLRKVSQTLRGQVKQQSLEKYLDLSGFAERN